MNMLGRWLAYSISGFLILLAIAVGLCSVTAVVLIMSLAVKGIVAIWGGMFL